MFGRSKREEKKREFEELALVHLDSLYRTALRLTGNEQEAEDLVQETFLKAYRFFHQFQRGTNCRAWLFTILRNTHINRSLRQARNPSTVDLEEVEPFYDQLLRDGLVQGSGDAAEEVLRGLLDEEVERALEELPEERRLVVILADVEGFTYKEIAQITNSPQGTVMSRLYWGRRSLQEKLWKYAREAGYLKGEDDGARRGE